MAVAISMGQSERVAQYEIPDDEMAIGSTLGGPKAVCVLKATGALQKVFSTDIGKVLFGAFVLRHYDQRTGMHLSRRRGGRYIIHPEHQEHWYSIDDKVSVVEDVFVLNGPLEHGRSVDPPAVYYCVTLTNNSDEPREIASYGFVELRGETSHDVEAEYDKRRHALIAWNKSQPDWVRILACSVPPESHEVSADSGKAVSGRCPGPLTDQIKLGYDPLGALHHVHRLQPGESARCDYILTFGKGRDEAARHLRACPPASDALDRTRTRFHDVLKRAVVFTPSEEVNRGALWAKANMLRVLIQSPTGWCFVNDPTRSNNSVGRDTAWFAYGADYFAPEFARESLMAYVQRQEENGLILEYYDIRGGKTEDYGLNINDNTPLLILALWHHYNATGDRTFLEEVYPAALKAGERILAERNEQGLVFCTAKGTSDWGIIGWRNVISDYRLSGATTEVNSESYAALKTLGQMARVLDKHEDSAHYADQATALREAINTHLGNGDNGLYLLSIGVDGERRTDVTSDLVFPVMFEVADKTTSAAIISRLSDRDFWTDAGIRTTPRDAPDYDPDGKSSGPYGLLGGVWVGVSFWYAFAAARYNPEFMDRALSDSFRNYSEDPRRNNTVPGQFSEWLHGETLVNQGMMLSPWFPPRYLWAAIEGAAGLDMSGDDPTLHPCLAADWQWLGVRNLPIRGRRLAWLAVRAPNVCLYTNFIVQQSGPYRAYDEDISEQVRAGGESVCTLGLRRGDELLLFVGSTADEAMTTAVRVDAEVSGSYRLRSYQTLLGDWQDGGLISAEELRNGLITTISRKGFALFELTQER